MPLYDSTFILNPQLEEGGLDDRVKSLVELVEQGGGKMIRENRIGMRRLAYEIQKLTQGYYISLIYDGPRELVDKLEHRLRLDESCLRFLTCHALKSDYPGGEVAKGAPAAVEAASGPKAAEKSEAVEGNDEKAKPMDEEAENSGPAVE